MSRNLKAVLCVAFVGHALAALVYAYADLGETIRGTVYFGSKILINALPAVWIFGVEKKAFPWRRPTGREALWGVGTGLGIGGVILALYYLAFADLLDTVELREKVAAFGAVDHFFLFAPFLCLINSALEEYYWRWFMFRTLRRVWPLPSAALLSTVGFTLHHIVVLSVYFHDVGLVALLNAGVFAGGVIWAWLYEKCGGLYAPWISHIIVDAAIMIAAHDILFG